MLSRTAGQRFYDRVWHSSLARSAKGRPPAGLWNGFDAHDEFLFGTERQLRSRCAEVFGMVGRSDFLPLDDQGQWDWRRNAFEQVYQSFFRETNDNLAFAWLMSRYTNVVPPHLGGFRVRVAEDRWPVPASFPRATFDAATFHDLPLLAGQRLRVPLELIWPASFGRSELAAFARCRKIEDLATRYESEVREDMLHFLTRDEAAMLREGWADVGSVDTAGQVSPEGVRYWRAYVLRLGRLSPTEIRRPRGGLGASWMYPKCESVFLTIHPGLGSVVRIGTGFSDFNNTVGLYPLLGAALGEFESR